MKLIKIMYENKTYEVSAMPGLATLLFKLLPNDGAVNVVQQEYPISQETSMENLQDKNLVVVAKIALGTIDFHTWPAFYNPARELLKKIAFSDDKTSYYLRGENFGTKGLGILVGMALLSSFSMADSTHDSPFHNVIMLISMVGAAVFNYLGGRGYSGFDPQRGQDWTALILGICSAIPGAIMTAFGVASLSSSGALWILAVAASLCNLLLASGLAAEALKDVGSTIKDFIFGDYHSLGSYGTGYMGSGVRHLVAGVEVLMYTLLAFYLSYGRTYETARFFYAPPGGGNPLTHIPGKSDWSYWTSWSGGIAFNIPEALLFLRLYLKLRMRIYDAIKRRQWLDVEKQGFSTLGTIALAFSFYVVMRNVTATAWERTLDIWLEDTKVLETLPALFESSYAQQYSGAAGSLLLIGTHNSLAEMGNIISTAANSAWTAVGKQCRSTGNRTETTPLLAPTKTPSVGWYEWFMSCLSPAARGKILRNEEI